MTGAMLALMLFAGLILVLIPVMLILIATRRIGRARITSAEIDPLCPECGYNVKGLPRPICPECGTPFDLDEINRPAMGMPIPIVEEAPRPRPGRRRRPRRDQSTPNSVGPVLATVGALTCLMSQAGRDQADSMDLTGLGAALMLVGALVWLMGPSRTGANDATAESDEEGDA